MSTYDFDLFVIGAGSGGVRAARIAAGHGARVAICEHSRVGGTCVIRGCVPKKLLSYAAHFKEDFEDAAAYGWELERPRFDWQRLIAAKDLEIDRLNSIYLGLLESSGVALFSCRGTLLDEHHVVVGERTLSAEKILIAVGGRPWVPEFPGSELVITSDEAFHLRSLPERVAIVGGGYIACEFAGIFNGLGAQVHQLYRGDRVLRGFDEDVRIFLGQEMREKGIQFHFERTVQAITQSANGIELRLDNGTELAVDCVMYATGRVPATADLGLASAGVAARADGSIPVDEYSRTNVPNIFAVGDVTHRIALTPVAIMEGHAFADSEFGGSPRPVDHAFVPSAVFSNPQVGSVGYSEQAAPAHCGEVDVYKSEFRPLKHTVTGRNEKTLMKLVVEHLTDRVVGVHVCGADAAEIVQGFAVAVKSGLTKGQFDATVGIHPTSAEELVTLRTPFQG